jgi:hypothetical protein
VGQPGGADSGKRQRFRPPALQSPLWTAMPVPGAKILLPLEVSTPLPAYPIPEPSQGFGMGPRDQARRLPLDGPKGWQSGQAIHPSRL